MLAGLKND